MKRRMARLLSMLLIVCGCTEPIGIEGTEDATGLLVIEGFVSTEYKRHSVRLTETARYGTIFDPGGFVEGVSDAVVLVRDDQGKTFEYQEIQDGRYESIEPFRAEVGKSYSILTELPDGRSYLSLPVLVTPVAPISSSAYSYEEVLDVSKNKTLSGFEIAVSLRDPTAKGDFYLWQVEGLYELKTFPELHEDILIPPDGPPVIIPDPKECCGTCWHREDFESVIVATDNLFNGNEISQSVIFLEDDGLRFFNEKYRVKIWQYAINGEVYEFYSQLYDLIDIDGDIFDPPPSTLLGNIINVDDPNEFAIGFFWAADVAIDSLFLDPSDLLKKIPLDTIKDDCRETKGTTTIEPIFWNIE